MEQVDLFVSCLVDLFQPDTGRAAVAVMERRGAQVGFGPGQTCCGQFAYNAGHWPEAWAMAKNLLAALDAPPMPGPDRQERATVGLSGSCVAMVREEYPKLLDWAADQPGWDSSWRVRHARVAGRLWELSQWLNRAALTPPLTQAAGRARVALHTGCHMRRVLAAGGDAAEVLEALGVSVATPEDEDQCCGFGGTYAMNEPKISTALADDKLTALRATQADAMVSCDWGCLLHLAGRLSRTGVPWPVLHLAELVDLADRGELAPAQLARAGRFVREVP